MVKVLRTNILIGNDIFAPKNFVLNVGLGHVIMESCGIKITIRVRQSSQFLRKRLIAKKDRVISPCFEAMILLLPVPLPDGRNFMFYPTAQVNLTLFIYIIHHNIIKVFV